MNKTETPLQENRDMILYHVAEPILDEKGELQKNDKGRVIKKSPTHTLAFVKEDDTLYMSYAQARSGLDTYRKATGRHIALARLNKLKNMESYMNPIDNLSITEMGNVLPNNVNNSIDYYLDKVRSYFKIKSDVELIFKGDKRTESSIVIMTIPKS